MKIVEKGYLDIDYDDFDHHKSSITEYLRQLPSKNVEFVLEYDNEIVTLTGEYEIISSEIKHDCLGITDDKSVMMFEKEIIKDIMINNVSLYGKIKKYDGKNVKIMLTSF